MTNEDLSNYLIKSESFEMSPSDGVDKCLRGNFVRLGVKF